MLRATLAALAVALVMAALASPFASSAPDGLERVAADQGFVDRGRTQDAPVPDYGMPGVEDPRVATGLAGFAGTLAVFALGAGLTALVRRPRPA